MEQKPHGVDANNPPSPPIEELPLDSIVEILENNMLWVVVVCFALVMLAFYFIYEYSSAYGAYKVCQELGGTLDSFQHCEVIK